MKTARLVAIDSDHKSSVVYADAEVSGGCPLCSPCPLISGVGFSYDDGKYAAMWDLAQRLTDLGIEVE